MTYITIKIYYRFGRNKDFDVKLSTRTRYGLRATLELALQYNKGPLQIKTIAHRQDISIKYLEQIIAILKSSDFVESVRGPHGGYLLAKNPEEITLYDLFRVLEGPGATVECLENKNHCSRQSRCVARQAWAKLQQAIDDVLKSLTLQELVNKTKERGKLPTDVYTRVSL